MIRVLLVDDDPDVLETTAALLELAGLHVRAVSRAADVLPALAEEGADVLLQDVHMPDLPDLQDLLERVRAAHPKLKVILFSAAADAADAKRRTGAHDLVTKPFDARRLARTIEQWHRIRTLV